MSDGDTIYALSGARTNAELIEQCAHLGYLRSTDTILDTTWGLGRFWSRWRPAHLIGADLDARKAESLSADLTQLPLRADSVDVVVTDVPFKENGSGGSHASDEGYGVADQWHGSGGRMSLLDAGFSEALRVVRPGGVLLYKVMDQVVGTHVSWQAKHVWRTGLEHGCEQIDELILRSNSQQPRRGTCTPCGRSVMMRKDGMWATVNKGKDPEPWLQAAQRVCSDMRRHVTVVEDEQQHARRNYSTLLIFRAPGG